MARLDSRTRWARHRGCVERWKARNREYYLAQKRRLAQRPEYLQRRRELYRERRARQTDEVVDLSPWENANVSSEANENSN